MSTVSCSGPAWRTRALTTKPVETFYLRLAYQLPGESHGIQLTGREKQIRVPIADVRLPIPISLYRDTMRKSFIRISNPMIDRPRG